MTPGQIIDLIIRTIAYLYFNRVKRQFFTAAGHYWGLSIEDFCLLLLLHGPLFGPIVNDYNQSWAERYIAKEAWDDYR